MCSHHGRESTTARQAPAHPPRSHIQHETLLIRALGGLRTHVGTPTSRPSQQLRPQLRKLRLPKPNAGMVYTPEHAEQTNPLVLVPSSSLNLHVWLRHYAQLIVMTGHFQVKAIGGDRYTVAASGSRRKHSVFQGGMRDHFNGCSATRIHATPTPQVLGIKHCLRNINAMHKPSDW